MDGYTGSGNYSIPDGLKLYCDLWNGSYKCSSAEYGLHKRRYVIVDLLEDKKLSSEDVKQFFRINSLGKDIPELNLSQCGKSLGTLFKDRNLKFDKKTGEVSTKIFSQKNQNSYSMIEHVNNWLACRQFSNEERRISAKQNALKLLLNDQGINRNEKEDFFNHNHNEIIEPLLTSDLVDLINNKLSNFNWMRYYQRSLDYYLGRNHNYMCSSLLISLLGNETVDINEIIKFVNENIRYFVFNQSFESCLSKRNLLFDTKSRKLSLDPMELSLDPMTPYRRLWSTCDETRNEDDRIISKQKTLKLVLEDRSVSTINKEWFLKEYEMLAPILDDELVELINNNYLKFDWMKYYESSLENYLKPSKGLELKVALQVINLKGLLTSMLGNDKISNNSIMDFVIKCEYYIDQSMTPHFKKRNLVFDHSKRILIPVCNQSNTNPRNELQVPMNNYTDKWDLNNTIHHKAEKNKAQQTLLLEMLNKGIPNIQIEDFFSKHEILHPILTEGLMKRISSLNLKFDFVKYYHLSWLNHIKNSGASLIEDQESLLISLMDYEGFSNKEIELFLKSRETCDIAAPILNGKVGIILNSISSIQLNWMEYYNYIWLENCKKHSELNYKINQQQLLNKFSESDKISKDDKGSFLYKQEVNFLVPVMDSAMHSNLSRRGVNFDWSTYYTSKWVSIGKEFPKEANEKHQELIISLLNNQAVTNNVINSFLSNANIHFGHAVINESIRQVLDMKKIVLKKLPAHLLPKPATKPPEHLQPKPAEMNSLGVSAAISYRRFGCVELGEPFPDNIGLSLKKFLEESELVINEDSKKEYIEMGIIINKLKIHENQFKLTENQKTYFCNLIDFCLFLQKKDGDFRIKSRKLLTAIKYVLSFHNDLSDELKKRTAKF